MRYFVQPLLTGRLTTIKICGDFALARQARTFRDEEKLYLLKLSTASRRYFTMVCL
jgi:hypothetical protein